MVVVLLLIKITCVFIATNVKDGHDLILYSSIKSINNEINNMNSSKKLIFSIVPFFCFLSPITLFYCQFNWDEK